MSIYRDRDGCIVFRCNECGDKLETDEDDFSAALQALREEGWVYEQDENGRWAHYCSGACG